MFTGIYFTITFILGSLILVPLMPIVWLLGVTVDKKGTLSFFYGTMWAYLLMYNNPFWRFEIEGLQNVDPKESYIIMANHQAMMDIPMIYKLPLAFRWVSKREVISMPVVGWALWLQRGIMLDRSDSKSAKKMITDGCNFLARGVSIMIFPEGTRSKTGRVEEFLPGAFLMAMRAKKSILPLVVDGGYDMYEGGLQHTFKLKVLPPITAEEIAMLRTSELSQKLNTMIREEHKKMAPDRYKTDQQK